MIVTIHQPAYIPWLGYFDKIIHSDIYVYLDTVQFDKRGFIHRNKIKPPDGPHWLTVPVDKNNYMNSTLMELKINNTINWQKKHLQLIEFAYKKAPFFDEIIKKIEPFYLSKYESLVDFCYDYLLLWFSTLGIKTKVIRASKLNVFTHKTELNLDICRKLGASEYISGAMGKDYLDESLFDEAGIKVVYQDYHPKVYPQLWGDFIPCLSILDFVMNTRDYGLITGGE